MIDRRSCLIGGAAGLFAGCAERQGASAYTLEVVARSLANPWSAAFLPDGGMLITEKRGGVRLLRHGRLTQPLPGGPTGILANGDSGLLDIALAPDFERSGEVFVAFTEGLLQSNQLALFRARIDGEALIGGEVVWRAAPSKAGSGHSGGRIAFLDDGSLLLTSGEGYDYRDQAQDLRSHLGKVLRLDRDGRAPHDNPFSGRDDAAPEVFTYGHRNPLGLLHDPRDGAVWLHEMGPRGGDELNLLTPGANYGWPRTTWGTDYDGAIISPLQQMEGVEDPVVVWNPSISPSGLALYLGDAFPHWRGDFFVGALSGRHLRRVRIRDGVAVLQEILLHERETRIRDVRAGPDGYLYLLTDSEDGEIWRVRPS